MVRKQRHIPYHFILFRLYFFYLLVFHFFPRYCYHFLKRPYCKEKPTIDYQFSVPSRKQTRARQWHQHGCMKRHRRNRPVDVLCKSPQKLDAVVLPSRSIRALHDTMISFLLDGYVELTGAELAPGTGQMAFLFIELAKKLDKHLDTHLIIYTSLPIYELLDVHTIQNQFLALYRHIAMFGYAMPIIKYLMQSLITYNYYDRYIYAFSAARNHLRFEDTLEVTKIDSGLACLTVIEVVCLFSGHPIDDEILNDFYLFGMVGKFADDMFDLTDDIEKGLPNLLYALVRQNPEEYARLQLAIKQGERLTITWWKKRCPLTSICYFKHVEHYYQQIKSSKVRRASMLMFILSSSVVSCLD